MEEKANQLADKICNALVFYPTGQIALKGEQKVLSVDNLRYLIKKVYIKGYNDAEL